MSHLKFANLLLKTKEVTRLQIGDDNDEINIVVSTLAEAEYLMDYLKECRDRRKKVNVRLWPSA